MCLQIQSSMLSQEFRFCHGFWWQTCSDSAQWTPRPLMLYMHSRGSELKHLSPSFLYSNFMEVSFLGCVILER